MLTYDDKVRLIKIFEKHGYLPGTAIRENSPGVWVYWYTPGNTIILFESKDKSKVIEWAKDANSFIDKIKKTKESILIEKYRKMGIDI